MAGGAGGLGAALGGLPGTLSCELSQFKHLCSFLGPYIHSGGLGAAFGGVPGTGRGVRARRGARLETSGQATTRPVLSLVPWDRPAWGDPFGTPPS